MSALESQLMLSTWIEALRAGEVIVCPTETQLGLLADALSESAVARVCAIKRRPAHEPIALLLPHANALHSVACDIPAAALALAHAHWPGALTLLVPALPSLPTALVRDGKVGVRGPGPSPALDVVRAFGGPLTATSANRSGQPPVQDDEEALRVFGEEVAAIVPGRSQDALPSTIVDATSGALRVLRQGAITLG